MRGDTTKRRGFTWIELVVVVAILLVVAAILFPVFARAPGHGCGRSCQSQLKEIALGFKQYVQDYDEKFPLVAFNSVAQSLPPYKEPFGWADAIQPYIKSTQIYQCPAEMTPPQSEAPDGVKPQFTDYWFNSKLAARPERELMYISNTFLLGDGNTGTDATNARYSIPKIPAAWIGEPKSPTSRHLDGMNFAFADGHVKWLKAPQSPMAPKASANGFSFEWK